MSVRSPGTFEERLLGELLAFQQIEGQAPRRARSTSSAPRRARSTSSAMGRRGGVLVGAAALVAVVALAGGDVSDTGRPGAPPASPTAPAPISLEAQTIAAMATNQVVFHSTVVQPSGVSELWRDEQTGAYFMRRTDASGVVVWEAGFRAGDAGAGQAMAVNYVDKTWGQRVVDGGPNPGQGDVPDTASALQEQLARNIESGRSMEDGTEVLDGRVTRRVKTVGARGETSTIWIDNETLLPVKQVSETVNASYSWAPRSAENLAALWPSPPPGFTRLDSPPLPPGVKLPTNFGRS